MEGPAQVGVEDGVPLVVGHARDQAVAGDPRVVDEDLDRSPRRLDLAEGRVDRGRVGDVGADEQRLTARGLDDPLRLLGAGVVASVPARDAPALGCELNGDGATDALGRAGDERDPSR